MQAQFERATPQPPAADTDSGCRTATAARRQRLAGAAALLLLALLSACAASPPVIRDAPPYAYAIIGDDSPAARHAPVFIPENHTQLYNRIGTPRAGRNDDGTVHVYVDPFQPAMFLQQQHFETARGRFTNFIYRVHFSEVPLSWIPFHLTAGPNGGLLIIVTVNAANQPLLVTTVHTCGCYLAIVPTGDYPEEALPPNWPRDVQEVYGERLPARIDYPPQAAGRSRLAVWLRDATHRVMHMELIDENSLARAHRPIAMPLREVAELGSLALADGSTTSFFYESGGKRGYVKNTIKPFERLFMSWWALDYNIGVDKKLAPPEEMNTVFYTSLKPWARQASDLWNFAAFLRYWGFAL